MNLRCRLVVILQVLAFAILLGTSLYQRSLLNEARAESAMYQEILTPIVSCLSNRGAVTHDGTSLRCVFRGKSTNLL